MSSPKLYQMRDCHRLTGRNVEVRLGSALYLTGRVDMVMPDGSGLWLAADAARSRQYIDKAGGYVLWADDPYVGTGI